MPTLRNVQKENVLADDELLTHVILPPPGNVRSGHYEVRYKTSHDWPLAFATVVVAMNGTRVASARVVLGAVAPVPWRSEEAEKALVGKVLNESSAAEAAEAAKATDDGWFNAAAFRDRLGNGRKVAIQILEFFDRRGITVRRGDLRRVDPRRLSEYD